MKTRKQVLRDAGAKYGMYHGQGGELVWKNGTLVQKRGWYLPGRWLGANALAAVQALTLDGP